MAHEHLLRVDDHRLYLSPRKVDGNVWGPPSGQPSLWEPYDAHGVES